MKGLKPTPLLIRDSTVSGEDQMYSRHHSMKVMDTVAS